MQGFNAPVLDLENQVKAFFHVGMLMRCHDNRQRAPGIISKKIIKDAPVLRVQAGEGFVQQKNLRLLAQRARNEHTLLLPSGKGVEWARCQLAQTQPAQCRIGLAAIRPARAAKHAQMRIPACQYRLPNHHREMPFDEVALGKIGDTRIAAGCHGALDADFPFHWREQSRQCL